MIIAIVIIFILLCVWKVSYGACAYIAIRLLIPAQIRMVGVNTSLNTFLLLILLFSCIYQQRKHLYYIYRQNQLFLKYIFAFIVLLLVCVPFGIVPFKEQLSAFVQMIITELIPAICIIIAINSRTSLNYFIVTFLICTIITACYGIFSYIIKSNPYYMYMITHYGDVESLRFTFDELTREKGALSGFSSGMATGGALKWSQVVLMSIFFLMYNKSFINRHVYQITISLLIINCFLTGQRAAFLSVVIGLAYIYKSRFTIKTVIISLFAVFSFVVLVESNSSLNRLKANLYSSVFIWDDTYAHKQGIRGSSYNMRLTQTTATLKSLAESPLGKGQSYIKVYHEKYGKWGVMRGFESIIYKSIWESGVFGIIGWSLLFFGCYKFSNNTSPSRKIYSDAFFIAYISTILMTGIQTTLYLFMIQIAIFYKCNYLRLKKR